MTTTLLDNASVARALVVDDDEFTADVMMDMLKDLGASEVKVIHDAQLALDSIRGGEQFDLLLCDLSMPGLDGIEFMRAIGTEGFGGRVILMSGMDSVILRAAETLARSFGLNLLGTFQKPVPAQALRTLLAQSALPAVARKSGAGSADTLLSAAEIRTLLDNDGLCIHYQPKVTLANGRLVGAECLCRLRGVDGKMIAPYLFLPVIESSGMIDELTILVLTAVARQASQWRAQGLELKLAVNVSMHNLNRIDLPELYANIMLAEGIAPKTITLEITETQISHDFVISLDVLTRLRLKGFNLSVDDFGTGYSTMENLKSLPFTELKIDRAFVNGAAQDPAAGAIFESSIKLGRMFQLNLVAEGIETQQDWDFVAAANCDDAQGYFVARPMSADDFMVWQEKRKTTRTEQT